MPKTVEMLSSNLSPIEARIARHNPKAFGFGQAKPVIQDFSMRKPGKGFRRRILSAGVRLSPLEDKVSTPDSAALSLPSPIRNLSKQQQEIATDVLRQLVPSLKLPEPKKAISEYAQMEPENRSPCETLLDLQTVSSETVLELEGPQVVSSPKHPQMEPEDVTPCEILLELPALPSETLLEQEAPRAVFSPKHTQNSVDPEDVTPCETLVELPATLSETLLELEAPQAMLVSNQQQMDAKDVAPCEASLRLTLLELPAVSSETLLEVEDPQAASSSAICFQIGTPTADDANCYFIGTPAAKSFKVNDDAADECFEGDKSDDAPVAPEEDSWICNGGDDAPVAPEAPKVPRNASQRPLWRTRSIPAAAGAESHCERLRRARRTMASSKTSGF